MLIESKIISSIYWMGDRPMTRPYTGRHRTDNRRHDRLQIVKDQASVVLVTRRNRK